MHNLAQDLRFGLRMLRKNPGFATVAVLVLAVGIGANTAIFSVVNAVLLNPLPYPDSQRLVVVQDVQPTLGGTPMSYPQFLAWRDQKDVFEQVATFVRSGEALSGLGEPEQLNILRVSYNLLPMLGMAPIIGRNFTPQEEPFDGNPVVLLSYPFWKSRFHSDHGVVGQKLTLTDRVFTVIGVLPEGFKFGMKDPALVVPLRLDLQTAPSGLNFLTVIGKLRPGMSLEQGKSALAVALPRVKKLDANTGGAQIVPFQEFSVGNSRPLLLVLLGTVVFVLLIACANIANLLLARGAARTKEVAIRISLGAGRVRLVRQLLTESVLLAILGGILGVVLAWGGIVLLKSLFADRLPRVAEIHLSAEVLGFTALLSLLTGIIFGMAPSLQAARGSLQDRLKIGGWQSAAASGGRLRSALVVAEITLSLVPLAGAGLLIRSFMRLVDQDKGFASDHVLTMGVWPSLVKYKDPQVKLNYLQQILDRVQSLPGVRAAGVITDLPLSNGSTNGDVLIENHPSDPANPFNCNKEFIDGQYFAAMRIPLRAGRYFNDSDTSTSPKVVVVNESFAHKFFPGENPIGKHIDLQWGNRAWSEIVGVVGDSRMDTLATPIAPTYYALMSQKPELLKFFGFNLAVRTGTDPMSLLHSISGQVHQLDPNQALARVKTMDTLVSESLAPRRAPMMLMLVLAAVALFLASIGIYGVLSYFVLQRRQEIGVRMALGAARTDVLRLVLGEGSRLIVSGVVLGLLFSFLAARAMASLLFEVKPTDLPTFISVSAVLGVLALVACAVPAIRATQVDPLVVLRNE
jgi:putative ABC transport system permease protein